MADTPTFQPNPYANFDPSQFSNPYSLFSGALPWPSSYVGWPTDALGRPINGGPPAQAQPAANPGISLNSSAMSPSNTQSGIYSMGGAAALPQINQLLSGQGQYGNQNQNTAAGLALLMGLDPSRLNGFQTPQQQQVAAPAPAASSGPPYNQVLSALANPGKVTTPGATVPQAGSAQPGPGVLQQFLAGWKPAQSGPGSGFTQNLNTILRGLQGS